ncbi:hypothetical protein PG990_011382 [Apiospora arundinis]
MLAMMQEVASQQIDPKFQEVPDPGQRMPEQQEENASQSYALNERKEEQTSRVFVVHQQTQARSYPCSILTCPAKRNESGANSSELSRNPGTSPTYVCGSFQWDPMPAADVR